MKGVIPAMITSFHKNEELNEQGLRDCINFLIEKKVNGLYITGSTGEFFLMSLEERKRVVEITVDEVKNRIPIVAHIGSIGTHLSIELAQHAQNTGVNAISSLPPFYFNFSSTDRLKKLFMIIPFLQIFILVFSQYLFVL